MKIKAYEKIIWMIELGAIYLLGPKIFLLVHPEITLCVYLRSHFFGALNEGLLLNKSFTRNKIKICGHAAKYLCNFIRKFESDVM